MVKSVARKVMFVGRATTFMVGLAMILALVFGVASTALGANGNPFLLGKKNVASAISKLVKQGTGPALKLQVGAGQPPLAVNSTARVANLNAATAGRADSAASADSATNAQNAATLEGKTASEFANSVHTHSGEQIDSGTVAEARIDGAIARDSEVAPTVRSSYQRVNSTITLGGTASSFARETVMCPSGKYAVSGGAEGFTSTAISRSMQIGSLATQMGWEIWVSRTTSINNSNDLTIFVICQ